MDILLQHPHKCSRGLRWGHRVRLAYERTFLWIKSSSATHTQNCVLFICPKTCDYLLPPKGCCFRQTRRGTALQRGKECRCNECVEISSDIEWLPRFSYLFPIHEQDYPSGNTNGPVDPHLFPSLPLPKSVLCYWRARYDFWRTRHFAKTRTKWRATFIACSAQLGQKQTKLLRTAIERLWIIVVAVCVGCSESTSGVSHLKDIREVVHSAAGSRIWGVFVDERLPRASDSSQSSSSSSNCCRGIKKRRDRKPEVNVLRQKDTFISLVPVSSPDGTQRSTYDWACAWVRNWIQLFGGGGWRSASSSFQFRRHLGRFVTQFVRLSHANFPPPMEREGKCVARSVFEGQFLAGEVCFLGVGSSTGT